MTEQHNDNKQKEANQLWQAMTFAIGFSAATEANYMISQLFLKERCHCSVANNYTVCKRSKLPFLMPLPSVEQRKKW